METTKTYEPVFVDYEACGECGYDHAYEQEEAHAWHRDACRCIEYPDGLDA